MATGNGSSTMISLVVNPRIEGAGIRATKVGEIDWEETEKQGDYCFLAVKEREILVVGNVTCEEDDVEEE